MRLSIAQLRAAGLNGDQITKLVEEAEAADLERAAEEREQNRIRSRNYRARQKPNNINMAVTAVTHTQRDARDATVDSIELSNGTETALARAQFPKKVTSSESSKEDSKEVKKDKNKRARAIPEDWHPSQHHLDLCFELKVPLSEIEATFRETTAANGKLYVDHDAGFCTYIRNYHKFNRSNGGYGNVGRRQGSLLDAIAQTQELFGGKEAARRYVPGSSGPRPIGVDHREGEPNILSLPKR